MKRTSALQTLDWTFATSPLPNLSVFRVSSEDSLLRVHPIVLEDSLTLNLTIRCCPACVQDPILRLKLPRKEVIQPHLPVQLPCYDFVPVTSPTFGSSFLAVRSPTSGVADFHDVTGGVYKARERIQRTMADARLLATPTS